LVANPVKIEPAIANRTDSNISNHLANFQGKEQRVAKQLNTTRIMSKIPRVI
jgi:hypothetical protein